MGNEHGTGDEIALKRYKIISPILSAIEERADNGKISLLKAEACGQAGIRRNFAAPSKIPGRHWRAGFPAMPKAALMD
jgi:hypothetical protein